jgi:adenylate kinase
MNILIFGVQGSGKSTVGEYIAQQLGVPFIATGDIFREIREEGSSLSELVRTKIDRGQFVPDNITMEIVEKRLGGKDASSGFVLDGAPRNLSQVKLFKKKVDLIVLVELEKEEAVERLLSRARHDDTKESIEKRMSLYEEQTRPVVDYYQEKNVKIIKVDNAPAEEVVKRNLNDLLKELKRN